jgi:hypothetical protein
MTADLKKVAGPLGIAGAVLVCLPCLLPVLAVLIGAGALAGFGGWIGDNALFLSLGGAAVIVGLAALVGVLTARRRRAAACEPHGSELMVMTERRARRIEE